MIRILSYNASNDFSLFFFYIYYIEKHTHNLLISEKSDMVSKRGDVV